MNNPVELNQSLDESTRQTYLAAMQVVQWEPSAIEQELRPMTEAQNEKPESTQAPVEINETANVINVEKPEDIPAVTKQHESTINAAEILSVESETNEDESNNQPQLSSEETTSQEVSTSHYLKMVNWTSRVLSEENANSLLIICRHQVDQPANSFARSNSPSQFMMDLIAALSNFGSHQNLEYKVQLAHLSAAGLSEDCIPLTDAIKMNKPKAVLLLGDETVTHLLGEAFSVANARGQVHTLPNEIKALVSYHPFSLIQNPALKRLAFEDLMLASELLSL